MARDARMFNILDRRSNFARRRVTKTHSELILAKAYFAVSLAGVVSAYLLFISEWVR